MKKIFVLALVLATLFTGTATAQDANNFTINSFDANYILSRDTERRSQLEVTETIVAQFPDSDQNHGIERALPQKYKDHTLHLKIKSVKDQNGKNWQYETSIQNGTEVIRIGDADTYVRGAQTYVITYTYNDVVDGDEWRWNTNGTQWRQPFLRLNATIQMSDELSKEIVGTQCYFGRAGESEQCNLRNDSVRAPRTLQAGENLTFQYNFKTETFADYQDPAAVAFVKNNVAVIGAALVAVAALVVAVSIIARNKFIRPRGDKGIIVPEYLPPKQVSVLQSSVVASKPRPANTAQIIDLAVRHYITIFELPKTGIISKKSNYRLQIAKPITDLLPAEQSFMQTLFGTTTEGTTVDINANSTVLATRLASHYKLVKKDFQATDYYVAKHNKGVFYLVNVLIIVAMIGLIIASSLLSEYSSALSAIGIISGVAIAVYAFVAIIVLLSARQLSEQGTALNNYILGLRDYMKVAEEERLTILQSPQGAEKTPVNTSDQAQLVALYERVLPYAVLLGIEKDWSQQMQLYYNETNAPSWYNGTTPFYAGAFAASMSDFSSSLNSYSSPSSGSSSSSGSGSGGGGGGGGGW